MSKHVMRNCVAAGCLASGLLQRAETRAADRLHILCYHRVLPPEHKAKSPYPDLVVTPEAFRRQCQIVKARFEVLPLHQAWRVWSRGERRTRPLATITFDDGYHDNYQYAAPILAELGLPATFFVIVDLIGTAQAPWFDRLARALAEWYRAQGGDFSLDQPVFPLLGPLPVAVPLDVLTRRFVHRTKQLIPDHRKRVIRYVERRAPCDPSRSADDRIMETSELLELIRAGHEIGSHGAAHEILTQLSDAELEREIAGSRTRLQDLLGQPVWSFCYPNGNCDDRVVAVTSAAGYQCAVTVRGGSNLPGRDPYRLRRRFMHEDRLQNLRGEASPLLVRMELCGLADDVLARKVALS